MEKSKYYKNNFPFEHLLPDLDEVEVEQIVNDCDYTIESDKIAQSMDADCVNTADAVVFYKMGYEAAKELLEKKLTPYR